jgi:hypothetical protein
MDNENLPMEPPEPGYLVEKHVLRVPVTDKHFESPWELRKYAVSLMEKKLGDQVQLTDLKVKKPGVFKRAWAKITGKVPEAELVVTIKF